MLAIAMTTDHVTESSPCDMMYMGAWNCVNESCCLEWQMLALGWTRLEEALVST